MPKINGVITRKLEHFSLVLAQLQSNAPVSIEKLSQNWNLRRAIERDLQVLIEILIDICLRIATSSSGGPVTSGRAAVERCVALGMLPDQQPWQTMIQFRNRLVHGYEFVDHSILADVVNNHLADFTLFRDTILPHLSSETS